MANAPPAQEAPAVDPAMVLRANSMTTQELLTEIRLLEDQIHISRLNKQELSAELRQRQDESQKKAKRLKDWRRKPWVIGHVAEILDPKDCNGGDFTAGSGLVAQDNIAEKFCIVKLSTREVRFLNNTGMIPASSLKPSDLVGCSKDSYMLIEPLPPEYDSRLRGMEVQEALDKTKYSFNSLGGLSKQIDEMIEAVVLPLKRPQCFTAIGIQPPNGVLMFGDPGTGKTALARCIAAQTGCTFLKLASTSLVQMYIGDGARIVRHAFSLAEEKRPAIIFLDELDAVGTRRRGEDQEGGREVQRTMMELLNQLDGFTKIKDVKTIAATNRIDVLDPALLRSGRFDRKVEFPLPDLVARREILQVHSAKIPYVKDDVNFHELAVSTPDFSGAMLKQVCVEAAMVAMRAEMSKVLHEHFMEGIATVQAKKKLTLNYYA